MRRRAALEAELPAIVKQAKVEVGHQLMAIYRDLIAAAVPALDTWLAAQAELDRLHAHVDTDYAGPASAAGFSALHVFPGPTEAVAVGAMFRRQIHPRRLERWREPARKHFGVQSKGAA